MSIETLCDTSLRYLNVSLNELIFDYLKSKPKKRYSVSQFPVSRNGIVDLMDLSKKQHNVHQVFEIDVTDLRASQKKYKETKGNSISFTACVVYSLAKAIDENKMMHAMKKGKKLITFDDVDVSTIIEAEVDGEPFPLNFSIRAANEKSILQIHQEIRNEQAGITDPEEIERREKALKLFKLPRWLRNLAYMKVRGNLEKRKEYYGTVGVTAVGMYSKVPTVFFPLTPLTTTIAVGTVTKKPVVIGNKIVIRDMLSVTLTFNHDIVDGSPVTRFISRFSEILTNINVEDLSHEKNNEIKVNPLHIAAQ